VTRCALGISSGKYRAKIRGKLQGKLQEKSRKTPGVTPGVIQADMQVNKQADEQAETANMDDYTGRAAGFSQLPSCMGAYRRRYAGCGARRGSLRVPPIKSCAGSARGGAPRLKGHCGLFHLVFGSDAGSAQNPCLLCLGNRPSNLLGIQELTNSRGGT
jgi:hypothetical protein